MRRYLWSSVYGRYGTGINSETGLDDAFMTLLDVLNARRVSRRKQPPPLVLNGTLIPWERVPDMLKQPPPPIHRLEALCGKDERVQRAGAVLAMYPLHGVFVFW